MPYLSDLKCLLALVVSVACTYHATGFLLTNGLSTTHSVPVQRHQRGARPTTGLLESAKPTATKESTKASYLTLQLDPARNSKVASKTVTAERIDTKEHPKAKKRLWNTPRWGKTDGNHVLWSRGWEDMIECTDVPSSYYAAGTEARHSATQMKSYFQNCGGLIWIRLNTGPTCDTQTFIEHVLPHMTKPFTLVTTDGDNSVPSRIAGAPQMLDHPLLERWLTQNYDGTIKHPKLHPFPIGFDLHTARPGKLGRVKGFPPLQAARTTQHVRENKILFDGMSMNGHRSHADQGLACVDHHHKRRMPVDAVWDEYRSYTFGASPHGNGLDCHRTWEMLYLGMVPIVESSSLDPLYEGLPVVVVNDWKHLCERNRTELYESVRAKLPVKEEVFTLEWWLGRNSRRGVP